MESILLLSIDQLAGRFHPLIVHLPIGMLLLAVIFEWVSGRERYRDLLPAVPAALLLGAAAAGLASLTGLLLSRSGDYASELLKAHQWMGIALTVVAAAAYLLKSRYSRQGALGLLPRTMPWLLLVLLVVTSHLGGNLTHGRDYLLEHLPPPMAGWFTGGAPAPLRTIADVEEALVYRDIVSPILEDNCYSCHGAEKQKGKLRLDTPEAMRKGGKSGVSAVAAGQPAASELLRRVLLPESQKKHMPPRQKRQLSAAEIALLEWWIEAGADTEKKVKELSLPEEVQSYLATISEGRGSGEEANGPPSLPDIDLPAPDPEAIHALRAIGVVVLPVGHDHPLLSVNFVNAPDAGDRLSMLEPLAAHITWLKLSQVPVNDSALVLLSSFPHLTRLYLDRTKVTDEGLSHLRKLQHLTYLNLVGTAITAAGVGQLQGMPALRELFLYQTGVSPGDWPRLTSLLKGVQLDSGGYQVPTLATDTTLVVAQ